MTFQVIVHLLRDDEILNTCQQRFAFAKIHSQRFHPQFARLESQDHPALLAVAIVAK